MKQDLGTYHLEVRFSNGEGYRETWTTGFRYFDETGGFSRLDVDRIEAPRESEQELIDAMVYMHTKGNYACDCNRKLFLAYARGENAPLDVKCGDELKLESLVMIRPDQTREMILDNQGEDNVE